MLHHGAPGRRSSAARQPAASHNTNDLQYHVADRKPEIHPQIDLRGRMETNPNNPATSQLLAMLFSDPNVPKRFGTFCCWAAELGSKRRSKDQRRPPVQTKATQSFFPRSKEAAHTNQRRPPVHTKPTPSFFPRSKEAAHRCQANQQKSRPDRPGKK